MEQHKCSICLKNFKVGDPNTLTTECKHCFHTSCFIQSLNNKNSCPICRKNFKFDKKKKALKRDRACDIIDEVNDEFNFFEKFEHAVMFNKPDIILTQIFSFGFRIAQEISSFYEIEDDYYQEENEDNDNVMIAIRNLRYRGILETGSEIETEYDLESFTSTPNIGSVSDILFDNNEYESIPEINAESNKNFKKVKEKIH